LKGRAPRGEDPRGHGEAAEHLVRVRVGVRARGQGQGYGYGFGWGWGGAAEHGGEGRVRRDVGVVDLVHLVSREAVGAKAWV
jgi:hypothetical protein